MVTTRKNKAPLNSTISPWLKKRVDEIAATDDFSSLSDLVTLALAEFVARYDLRKELEQLKEAEAEPIQFTAQGN